METPNDRATWSSCANTYPQPLTAAQRPLCKQKVTGSIPVCSTEGVPAHELFLLGRICRWRPWKCVDGSVMEGLVSRGSLPRPAVVVVCPVVRDRGRLDPSDEVPVASLLSTVHASASGLTRRDSDRPRLLPADMVFRDHAFRDRID